MTDERLTYRFGPLERRGILGQVRAGQAVAAATGVLAAIVVLDRSPTAAGAFLGMLLLGSFLLAAFAPLGRRTAEEWAPVALSFGMRWIRGRLSFRSRAPGDGMVAAEGRAVAPAEGRAAAPAESPAVASAESPGVAPAESPGVAPAESPGSAPADGRGRALRRRLRHPLPDAPAALKSVRILDVPYRGHPVGVLSELGGRRLTAVLACRVLAFSLLDADAQERRLARWGLILSGAAGGSVRRLQWIERTAPAQGDELARWLHAERDPRSPSGARR